MEIITLNVGPLATNCYLLKKQGKMLLIDPGDDADFILEHLDGELLGILITHRHFDHVGALKDILKAHPVDVYDATCLEEKEYHIGPFVFSVFFTKGHTKDSITYSFAKDHVLFTGDFLFREEIGRVDLPGGSEEEMIQSLKKASSFENDFLVYPGHGPSSTMHHEKKENPYLRKFGGIHE